MWPGAPYPLGATWRGESTNFALFSEVASGVELCLFDDRGAETRVTLPERTGWVWHGEVPGVGPGQRYGFRVHGPWAPAHLHRCNPSKLLLDPYARAIEGEVQWDDALVEPDGRDSAPFVPRSIVVDPAYDWERDQAPSTPWSDTLIYEAHVKGLTATHPDVPHNERGTYRGLTHPSVLAHLRALGITALELLPVHQILHRRQLVEAGLLNYWGYDSIGFFAPHGAYAASGQLGEQVREFKDLVRALHIEGIEVILDVDYNHTPEGDENGPTVAFRGIDNAAYYRRGADAAGRRVDLTGTGNAMNTSHPQVLQLVMDSLRYWVLDMHVDGFRFDLASTLARDPQDFDARARFFDLVHQDPVLKQVKLIAEPWDLGPGGYQLGHFPPGWAEWNGRYRDEVRDHWRRRGASLGELAQRLTGSSDLYVAPHRRPWASINYVTCHDGFTLTDLVSYEHKRNEANLEGGRDGTDDNRSWNCGVEGPTDDPGVLDLRDRQKRNFLATLLLSQGVPMLCAGDELGRTQHGNNNPYCHDTELSWVDWSKVDWDLVAFTQALTRLRREHPTWRRRRWLRGEPLVDGGLADVAWFDVDGEVMSTEAWEHDDGRAFAMFLNGGAIDGIGPRGEVVVDDTYYVCWSAWPEDLAFRLPAARWGGKWRPVLDTAVRSGDGTAIVHRPSEQITVQARSVVVLQRSG